MDRKHEELKLAKEKMKRSPRDLRGVQSLPMGTVKTETANAGGTANARGTGTANTGVTTMTVKTRAEDHVLRAELANPRNSTNFLFCVDSGASCHCIGDKKAPEALENYTKEEGDYVRMADGRKTHVEGVGSLGVLSGIKHIPGMEVNLISVPQLTKEGYQIKFENKKCTVSRNGCIAFTAHNSDGLYRLRYPYPYSPSSALQVRGPEDVGVHDHQNIATLWHRRLGHTGVQQLKLMAKRLLIPSAHLLQFGKTSCHVCKLGKSQRRSPKKMRDHREVEPGALVYADLFGPMTVTSLGGARYGLVLVDDATRLKRGVAIARKSDAAEALLDLLDSFKPRVQLLRTDKGGEFTSKWFIQELKERNIQHQLAVPTEHSQNSVAERAIRTITTTMRCMLLDAGLSRKLWAEAFAYSLVTLNRTPTSGNVSGLSPSQLMLDPMPLDSSRLRVFGERCYVHLSAEKYTKRTRRLGARAVQGRFVGWATQEKAFRVLMPDDTVTLAASVTFDKRTTAAVGHVVDVDRVGAEQVPDIKTDDQDEFEVDEIVDRRATADGKTEYLVKWKGYTEGENMWLSEIECKDCKELVDAYNRQRTEEEEEHAESTHTTTDLELAPEEPLSAVEAGSDNDTEPTTEPVMAETERSVRFAEPTIPTIRRSARIAAQVGTVCTVQDASAWTARTLDDTASNNDSPSLKTALSGPQAVQWEQAMNREMSSLESKGVWKTATTVPPGVKVLRAFWILKEKQDKHGNVVRLKARLVVNGSNSQTPAPFAPVSSYTTLRLFFAIANKLNLYIGQADVDTAFLNANVTPGTVFMYRPSRAKHGSKIVEMVRAMYGLPGSPADWNNDIHRTLESMGFKRVPGDECLYIKGRWGDKEFLLLILYVDDLAVTGRSKVAVDAVFNELESYYEIKRLGECNWMLGINVNKVGTKLVLSQKTYLQSILDRVGMTECKAKDTPMESGLVLTKCPSQSPKDEIRRYQVVIGSLLYAACTTRPDLSYSVSRLGRYASNPGAAHWAALKRVLQYVKGTLHHGISFDKNAELDMHAFTDASYAGCPDTRRSTTGLVFFACGGPICWESRRQRSVALSTMEAELMALSDGAKRGIWVRKILSGVLGRGDLPATELKCDNQATIRIVTNLASPGGRTRSKHIDVRYFFVRECIADGSVVVTYEPTESMAADILTKPLGKLVFYRMLSKLITFRSKQAE
jgi:transposase InsO family protein